MEPGCEEAAKNAAGTSSAADRHHHRESNATTSLTEFDEEDEDDDDEDDEEDEDDVDDEIGALAGGAGAAGAVEIDEDVDDVANYSCADEDEPIADGEDDVGPSVEVDNDESASTGHAPYIYNYHRKSSTKQLRCVNFPFTHKKIYFLIIKIYLFF